MFLLQKNEENGHDEAEKCCEMVPLERLSLKHDSYHYGEDGKGDHFLNYLQLHEVERSTVFYIANPVCGYLCAVLKECDSPREEDNSDKWPAGRDLHLLKFQMSVPCERHEDV